MKKRIPFGVWEPDSNAVGGLGRLSEAVNVVPVKGGYKVMDGARTVNGPLGNSTSTGIAPSNLIAGFSGFSDDQSYTTSVVNRYSDYLATTTSVYVKFGNNVSSTSDKTGDAPSSVTRDFCQYGQYVFLASGLSASATSPIVYANIGGSSPFLDSGAGFQAKCVGTLRDFLVAGFTYDPVDLLRPGRVRWSAFGDPFTWTPSPATQADIQDLQTEFGPVQRILGGNDAFVICENGVILMSYVGGATIMRFDYIHKEIGTIFPQSCVRMGDYVYMYSKSGFVRVGKSPGDIQNIGEGRVNRAFKKLVDESVLSNPLFQVVAYHDEMHKGIGWHYSKSHGKAFFFSYVYDQWVTHGMTERDGGSIAYASRISQQADSYTTFGLTLVDAPRVCTAAWVGSDQKLYTHNDNLLKAKCRISTGFEELSPGKKSIVDKVWPVQDVYGGSQTNPELVVTAIPKLTGVNLYAEPTSTYSSTASLQTDGFFTVTGPGSYEGKFHRFQLENSDTASERTGEQALLGIDVEFFERGNY